jgi:hypothetical protein
LNASTSAALDSVRGKETRAAEVLGINRKSLRQKVENLRPESIRTGAVVIKVPLVHFDPGADMARTPRVRGGDPLYPT